MSIATCATLVLSATLSSTLPATLSATLSAHVRRHAQRTSSSALICTHERGRVRERAPSSTPSRSRVMREREREREGERERGREGEIERDGGNERTRVGMLPRQVVRREVGRGCIKLSQTWLVVFRRSASRGSSCLGLCVLLPETLKTEHGHMRVLLPSTPKPKM